MIPRYQAVLFSLLFGASIAMGVVLWHLRDRAHQRLLAGQDTTPTQAPQIAAVEEATLLVASDADDTLQTRILALPLPPSPGERARAVLGKLMELYTTPGSPHPISGNAGSIAQVFLLPAGNPATPPVATAPPAAAQKPGIDTQSGPELAVVNLTSAFVSGHPSGIETETLTVLSICATLHANLPRVTQVRFLVDGQPRATLAGHADLTRTYLTADLTSAVAASSATVPTPATGTDPEPNQ